MTAPRRRGGSRRSSASLRRSPWSTRDGAASSRPSCRGRAWRRPHRRENVEFRVIDFDDPQRNAVLRAGPAGAHFGVGRFAAFARRHPLIRADVGLDPSMHRSFRWGRARRDREGPFCASRRAGAGWRRRQATPAGARGVSQRSLTSLSIAWATRPVMVLGPWALSWCIGISARRLRSAAIHCRRQERKVAPATKRSPCPLVLPLGPRLAARPRGAITRDDGGDPSIAALGALGEVRVALQSGEEAVARQHVFVAAQHFFDPARVEAFVSAASRCRAAPATARLRRRARWSGAAENRARAARRWSRTASARRSPPLSVRPWRSRSTTLIRWPSMIRASCRSRRKLGAFMAGSRGR